MAGQSDGWTTTARLLRRAGFGVTGSQVDTVAKQNWSDYIDAALRADPEADRGAVATPVPTLTEKHRPGRDAPAQVRRDYNREVFGMVTLSR